MSSGDVSAPANGPLVSVRDVHFRYRKAVVLAGVTFDLWPGRTALLGPNGAGKTTLLHVLSGLLRLRRGSVLVDGREIDGTGWHQTFIGLLPQDVGVLPRATVHEQLKYVSWLKGLSGGNEEILRGLVQVGLDRQIGAATTALSGGQRRRLGICQALMGDPRVLLLDEPSAGLDPGERRRLREVLRAVTSEVVLVSTHLIDDLAEVFDHVIVLDGGRVRFDGTSRQFLDLGGSSSGPADDVRRAERAYAAVLT